jgi:HK97 family phage major capsid protein
VGFALKVDHAAMHGIGTGDEPTGLLNTTGIAKTNVAANGGPPTWDVLADSVRRVRDPNVTLAAQTMADRTARSLGRQKDSQGMDARMPPRDSMSSLRPAKESTSAFTCQVSSPETKTLSYRLAGA